MEAQKRYHAKKKGVDAQTLSSFVPKSDAETKKEFIAYMKSLGVNISERAVVADRGFIHLQGNQHRDIYHNSKIETSSERTQLWNHSQSGGGHGGRGGYVQTGNSFCINKIFRNSNIQGKIDANIEAQLRRKGATADDIKTIKLLDKKVKAFSLPCPIIVTRYVTMSALNSIFGSTFPSSALSSTKNMLARLSKLPSGTKLQQDPAFLSASTNETQNVFYGSSPVKLMIEIPPHTPMYFTCNFQESEVIFGRGTKMQYLSSSLGKTRCQWNVFDHLVIRCRMMP